MTAAHEESAKEGQTAVRWICGYLHLPYHERAIFFCTVRCRHYRSHFCWRRSSHKYFVVWFFRLLVLKTQWIFILFAWLRKMGISMNLVSGMHIIQTNKLLSDLFWCVFGVKKLEPTYASVARIAKIQFLFMCTNACSTHMSAHLCLCMSGDFPARTCYACVLVRACAWCRRSEGVSHQPRRDHECDVSGRCHENLQRFHDAKSWLRGIQHGCTSKSVR